MCKHVTTYNCSNSNCTLKRVGFGHSEPIYKKHTPEFIKSSTFWGIRKRFIIGFKDECLCWQCKKVVHILRGENRNCPECGGEVFEGLPGEEKDESVPCRNCNTGNITQDVIWYC